MKERVMKNFSEEEEGAIRGFLFTNPGGDTSFIYPQPLFAGEELSPLMSAYSRTHVPMQDRVLQFLDKEKTEQTRAMLPLIKPLVEIFRETDGTLRISRRTGDFNKEWVLAHGHSSIKEETPLFGHVENISDIAGKTITGHPLCKPQVKSTRYLSYAAVLDKSLGDVDILELPNSEVYVEHVRTSNTEYLRVTEELTDKVFSHKYTKAVQEFLRTPGQVALELERRIARKKRLDDSFQPGEKYVQDERAKIFAGLEDDAVRRDVGKFVLDYSRSYLLAVNKTSLGFSVDARTLEEIITRMISNPRKEDQERGRELWTEARKIAPVLLGEKSHVDVDTWRVSNELEFRDYVNAKFEGIIPTPANGMVRVITPKDLEMYSDRFNATLAVYPYTDLSLMEVAANIKDADVKEILEKAHQHRGERDGIHEGISHGGLMVEMTMPFHAYRDMFRHRRGSRSTQLLTTRLGYEIPDIFSVFGLDGKYIKFMEKSAELYERARNSSRHIAEKLVPFGANCRALHSWQPNQVEYVGHLRSDIAKGNLTYVRMAREMVEQVGKLMPLTSGFFRCDRREYPVGLWKRGYDWYDQTQRGK